MATGILNPAATEVHRVTAEGGGCAAKVYPWVAVTYRNPGIEDSVTTVALVEGERTNYFVPEDWLVALTYLQDISKCFYNVGTLRDGNNNIIGETASDSFKFTYSYLKLPVRLFQKQSKISNAAYAFAFCISLGATELDANFMRNSLGTLLDISNIFFASELKSIGTETSRVFESGALNGRLNAITRAFYGVNTLGLLDSWFYNDGGLATDENDQLNLSSRLTTSYAPRFYDTDFFTNIDINTLKGTFYATYAQPYYKYANSSYSVDSTYNSGYTAEQNIDLGRDIYTVPTYAAALNVVNL